MEPMPPPDMPEQERPWWKQRWGQILLFVVLFSVAACMEVASNSGGDPEEVESPSEVAATEQVTEAPAAPVTVEGSDGNTEPFTLPEGRSTVTIETSGDCVFSLDLRTVDDEHVESLPSVEGNSSTSGELYGLDGGEYFIEAITGPPERCSWVVTFTPLG